MEKFRKHTGIGVPFRESAVDTDQILPARYLKRITKSGYEDALFEERRRDPGFVLNQDPYKHGSILVAGRDFGTGSSREHAVWALRDYGFKAVLSPRFADIFQGNMGKQGLVAGVITDADAEQIWKILESEPGTQVTVDLENKLVTCAEFVCGFDIDDYTRWRLMEGLDDIALTLRDIDLIEEYEKNRPSFKPTSLPQRHLPNVPVRSARIPGGDVPID
ncbi:3-isopropylmalate dehydratase small subunit [Actinotignum urinale]|uniref:3-isopropylmalate dehydratase small subunit n=1 Tax=Actinotignum urinale TaxID=190146 RepID=UPI0003B5BF25|nr:3-isopropylmalate dehydratase small subunit [Actinotignum urinale]MDY5160005.1 3-isopropylmalate dehydratase small subunit [Actinotignum urinale]